MSTSSHQPSVYSHHDGDVLRQVCEDGLVDACAYDAIVLVSFGGPEEAEEVVPFLRRVTAGRNIPDERLRQVGEHYFLFGGRSPINEQNRALLAALRTELDQRGVTTPLWWGNRNAAPFLGDTFTQIAASGAERVLAVTTSAYPSYSSCRQYREDLAAASAGYPQLSVDRIRNYANTEGFIAANLDRIEQSLAELQPNSAQESTTEVVFVTHSIPLSMADTSGPEPHQPPGDYVRLHEQVQTEIMRRINLGRDAKISSSLTFCSRSGDPRTPWLEPDINDRIRELAAAGKTHVVVAPIGFISDHMEVKFDLDVEAAETARECGLAFVRAGTAGTHPRFVGQLVDLIIERGKIAEGIATTCPAAVGAAQQVACPAGCCPNLRDPHRPALACQ